MHGIGPEHMIGEGHDMKEDGMEVPLVPTASTFGSAPSITISGKRKSKNGS